ncbi:unnamed protein product [Pleuronectes platessa]|uniref:Uncharacterized protein n=1 Tax=Pleuronectes platessa TaxID=8262 RepID=A0A9N7ZDH9_PLEPL|nr:unnamed protein product [Pleuronectes platessa]
MVNYRTKLSRAGIKDMAVNAGKRSRTNPEGEASRANIKSPKGGDVNFHPNYPLGETKDTLETMRLGMVQQFKRTSIERDAVLIHQLMQRTFALALPLTSTHHCCESSSKRRRLEVWQKIWKRF